MDSASTIFPSYNSSTNKTTLQKNCVGNEGLIDKLFDISPNLFSEEVINALFKIYDTEDFNLLNFSLFQELTKCNVFVDYVNNDNVEKNNGLEKCFNFYFSALACTRLGVNLNAVNFKNKICTLLKINLKLPSYRSGMNIKNINVNVSSSYKPAETEHITANCDIVNVIKEEFFNTLDMSNVEMFHYTPQIANVALPGPTLKRVFNSVINMQCQLLEIGKAHGMKIEPFIENNNKKLQM